MELSWETLDWKILDRLRARFLAGEPAPGPYWTSRAELANYDFTYARRIGWKWHAVLRELTLRGWRPPAGPLLDWGCGTGMAGRRVLAHFGAEHFQTLHVRDHSPLAEGFAAETARAEFPGLTVKIPQDPPPFRTLLLSHVGNELGETGRATLRALIDSAAAVLWVEPGTYADSRALIGWREELLADFEVVAPCTHRARCGMLNAHNAPHWCHHFAAPPPEVLSDVGWTKFARRAGIDLRASPYSFLVLARSGSEPGTMSDWTRVIGRPRVYKGYAKVLDCSREDVTDIGLQERDNRVLFRELRKGRYPTLLRTSAAEKDWKVAVEIV